MDFAFYRRGFDEIWQQFMAKNCGGDEPLAKACRYALAGSGKRIRPLLVFFACEASGGSWEHAIRPAIAVEMVHTYSLVHDDLPSLDNDDWRRGRPTVHKVFNEATALLVGDALLTDACAVLSGAMGSGWQEPDLLPSVSLAMMRILMGACGSQGMVAGQMMDLCWTGRSDYSLPELNTIHHRKTGALLGAACALGALAGGGSHHHAQILQSIGESLGMAFQVIDDLLDEQEGTGKSKGKDRAQGKLTYLSLMSRADAQAMAAEFTAGAMTLLDQHFGQNGRQLQRLAAELLRRQK